MSFIIKSEGTVLNTKLTSIGRKLLASGSLNFSYYVVGDSNISYGILDETTLEGRDLNVLKPKDKNPDIISWLLQTPTADKYNAMSSSNINVSELLVVNSAPPRGFFSSITVSNITGNTLINSSTYFKGKTTYDVNTVAGGKNLTVASVANISVGNFVMVSWLNPSHASGYDISTTIITSATPFLTYKVEGITGTTLGLDRNVPNFNAQGSGQGYVYSFPAGDSINEYYGSGLTTNYWFPDTLSLDGNCMISNDPPVLNLNIVYLDSVDGTNTTLYEGFESYGSFEYIGFENYIGTLRRNPIQKAIGLIHYTNHSVANVYGEQLYGSTIRIDLPTILSHKTSDNNGLTLISDTTKKTQILDTDNTTVILNTTYYDLLVKNPASGANTIVGKVFNDLKVIVIEDMEILSAMGYKSNRNWTYPSLISSVSPKFTTETQLFSNTSEVLYVTYVLDSTLPYDSNVSYGYKAALHCQELTTISGTQGINNSAVVYVDYSNLKFYKDLTSGGQGYTANRLKLIMQKVANSSTKPDPTAWKVLDVTSSLPNYYTFSASTIPSSALLNQPIRIDGIVYSSGVTYDINTALSIPLLTETSRLQFGDEAFLFGTLYCDISAIVYRTKLNFTLSQNLFNTSSNESYIEGNDCYIDSIGVYDTNKNLVAIAKTSYPIKKNNLKTAIIEVDLDF